MVVNFLDKAGLNEGWIYEVIVESSDGHAAPMGVKFGKSERVEVSIYKSSKTAGKISGEDSFRIYFVDDVSDVKIVLDSKRMRKDFASALVEVSVEKTAELKDVVKVLGKISSWEIKDDFTPINRAPSLFLEALIESTKPKPRKETIRECLRVISKVAPKSVYEKKIRELL
ncbi:MAG: DUF447 domain-containing protein [Methanobacteriota archaeon]